MMSTLKTYQAFRTILFTIAFLLLAGLFSVVNAEKGFLVRSHEYRPVEPNSVEDLLSYLEAVTKDNYDKIETWQGIMEFTSIRGYYGDDVNHILVDKSRIKVEVVPNGCEELSEGTTNFKADLKRDMRWIYINRPEDLILQDAETKQILSSPGYPSDLYIIRTPDIIMEANPSIVAKDGSALKRSAIKYGNEEGHDEYQPPTKFFHTVGPTWYLPAALKKFLFHNNKTPKVFRATVVIEKKSIGDNTEIYIRFGMLGSSHKQIENFYEILLPSSAGYNPTLIRILDAPTKKLRRKFNISYVELDGVYLPSNYEEIRYNTDGKVTLYKQYTLKEQKINEVIPEVTFTYNNLGLQDGDKFIDKIENKEYRYRAATKTLEPITE